MANNQVAYGFMGLTEMFADRVTSVNMGLVIKAVQDSQVEYNRQLTGILAALASRVTVAQERYIIPGAGTLQPLDEWGNPLPVAPLGHYDCGYPIQGGGTAYGNNRVTRALMTVGEVNRSVWQAQQFDADWVRRHALAALFAAAAWTFTDPEVGSVSVQPLANGDAVTYVRVGGSASVDTHQLAQADAIADAHNPFPTIYEELVEHPGNGANIAVYCPTNLITTIKALASFVEVSDTDIALGANQAQIIGAVDTVRKFGDTVWGKADRCWIVEWKALPDNYMIGLALDADAPLAMREYAASELQGFFTETATPDGNRIENRYIRYAGFGARNRVAALAYRIGNAAYAVPTGYTPPLAV
jgi:hypothetical protein